MDLDAIEAKAWALTKQGLHGMAETAAVMDAVLDGPGVGRYAESRIDWHELWTAPEEEAEFLIAPVIARGRAHSIVASAKVGKSLFALYLSAHAAAGNPVLDHPGGAPVRVLYCDYEMTRADVKERLASMGFGADTNLDALIYQSLPKLPPLDTPQGGAELVALARHHAAELVVIDTLSRTIAGEENDSKTFQNFAMYVGLPLKADGIAYLRADHMGLDPTRGERGSSAKRDDVDVAWKLYKRDGGKYDLDHGDVCRVSWIPKKVSLAQETDPITTYRTTSDTWPAGTRETAKCLDEIGFPFDAGRPKARAALKEIGFKASTDVISAALRFRRGTVLDFTQTTEGAP